MRRIGLYVIAAIVLALLPSHGSAEIGYCTIKGTVLDDSTGESIVGAVVSVRGTEFGGLTDSLGRFVIRNLPTGHLFLAFAHIDYFGRYVSSYIAEPYSTVVVDQRLRPRLAEIDQTIFGGRYHHGTIMGQIRDTETGKPVIGAVVRIPCSVLGATTDRDGRFRIGRVYPGTYILQVMHQDYRTVKVDNVEVIDGSTTVADQGLSEKKQSRERTKIGHYDILYKFGASLGGPLYSCEVIRVRTVFLEADLLSRVQGIPTMTIDLEKAKTYTFSWPWRWLDFDSILFGEPRITLPPERRPPTSRK